MILLTGTDEAERNRLAGIFKEARVEAALPKDLLEAKACFRDKPLKVAFVCAAAFDDALLSALKGLDEARAARSVTMILVGDSVPDDFSIQALKAGVDGELRRQKPAPYVLAHAEAKARLGRRPAGEGLLIERAGSTAKAQGNAFEKFAGSKTWRESRDMLRDAAATFLTVPARIIAPVSNPGALATGCQILMGNASDCLELRIALGADLKSLKQLAMHLFGDDGEDMGNELMSELANILMGALKTSFSGEEIKFAAGLPEAVAAARVLQPATTYSVQTAFELQLADARVALHLGARATGATAVPVSGLREGMVIANDVYNPKGLMLVRAGTRLSLNMVEKLRGILTPKQQVEVMAA